MNFSQKEANQENQSQLKVNVFTRRTEMAATEAQIAGLEKARAARAQRATNKNVVKEVISKDSNSSPAITIFEERDIWFAAFNTALRNLDVKAVVDVQRAVPIADEVLGVFLKKFN